MTNWLIMPPKSRRKPLITKNWLPIESIHSVPNILSSKVAIANIKKARAAAGKPPTKIRWCIFCGRSTLSIQALRGHLQFCEKRKLYKHTMANGWQFTIGGQAFTVRTNRWSWIREAAAVEAELNQRIADGSTLEAEAITWYHWFVLGHQATYPRADAAIDPAPTTPTD